MTVQGSPRQDRSSPSPTEGVTADVRPDRFQIYAEALACFIDDPTTRTPLTMAIHAPWGTGKSFLARRVFRLLQNKPAASGRFPHVGCWFNAWMHDDADNIATALVAHVAQSADRMRPWWRRFRSPLPVSLAPPGERTQRRLFVVFATILLGFLVSRVLLATFELGTIIQYVGKEFLGWELTRESTEQARTGFASHGAGWLAVASTLALAIVRRFAQIGNGLGGFLKDPQAAAASGSIDRVRDQLGVIVRQATPPGSRFVVFIDEVDLCRPPHCIDILETVSQLFDQTCIVTVIIADVSAIAAHAEIKYEKLASRYVPGAVRRERSSIGPVIGYGRVYLEKFLQLEFALPLECDASVIESALHRRTPAVAERGNAASPWLSLFMETLHPVTRPTKLARSLHRELPDADHVPGGAGRPGPGHAPRVQGAETFFGPMARLWDRPPGVWMFVVGGAFLVLLPARALVFAAARAAYPTEVRPFVVCLDRPWEKHGAAALVLCWTLATWSVALASGLGIGPSMLRWGAVAATGVVVMGALVMVLRRIDARDRRVLGAMRRSLVPEPSARSGVIELLREERRRRVESTESHELDDAIAEALRHLPPSPRMAKRAALLLRVELDVLQMLGLVAPRGPLTPRHLGKWVALRQRWPLLGCAVVADIRHVAALEAAAASDDPTALTALLPDGVDDERGLRAFLSSEPQLGERASLLVRLSYPPAPATSGSRERAAVASVTP